ncbi:MAG: hypothetical protein ACJ754_00140 [Pyrinomonadaceae bacterium]
MRLGLIVNGLYFISLFTPTMPHTRPRLFAHTREPISNRETDPPPTAAPPADVPFAPPAPRSRAKSYESGSLLHVSLDNDLKLITRPGHALLLSVNFSAPTRPPRVPEFVYFTFHLYTNETGCPHDCPLTIVADDLMLSPAYTRSEATPRTPSLSPSLPGEQPAETMFLDWVSARISYQQFNDIISAKRVLVRLGPDWVELSIEQIEALRDMQRKLPQLPPPDDSDTY